MRRATRSDTNRPCKPCNFYPRSPCGERPGKGPAVKGYRNFYPRSPCGERPWLTSFPSSPTRISIHALLAESDGGVRSSCFGRIIFLSTLSLRRATSNGGNHYSYIRISIHALLAESDPRSLTSIIIKQDFYPRSPCGERQVLFRQSA